jgi:aldose 1-epimerase
MKVENRSNRPMPAGMGWHPYFASRNAVKADAVHIWHHLPDYLPDGRRSEFDGSAGMAVPTAYLDSWTHADVVLTEETSVQIVASDAFAFLVVHRGDPAHVCVEPVTHLANAWNMDVPAENSGAVILAPGTDVHGVIEIAYSKP